MPRNVSVDSGPLRYAQTISVGPHTVQSDEPTDRGGDDAGSNPNELLMASLGACMNITAQMYAERHRWPLEGVKAVLSYARVRPHNPIDSDTKIPLADRIDVEISFLGNLSNQQKQRLSEIASRCPIHRMLISKVQIEAKLVDPDHRQ
jgi:putative redox protein